MSYEIKKFYLQRKVKVFKFLLENFDISMKEAQRWVDKGRINFKGVTVNQKSLELIGEVLVSVFTPKSIGLKPIFENNDFAVFDKPSGVLVHPTNRLTKYSLTHEAKYLYGKDANIVHRIDKETSGLVVVSKNKKVEKEIKWLFENREVKKGYIALVRGEIKKELFIDEPIIKNREFSQIKVKVQISKQGKSAQTIIKPLEYYKETNQTLVEAIPLTGRQHQIRVHLFHVKHCIVGDPIYGVNYVYADLYLNGKLDPRERIKITGANRLILHANWIKFYYKNRFKLFSPYQKILL